MDRASRASFALLFGAAWTLLPVRGAAEEPPPEGKPAVPQPEQSSTGLPVVRGLDFQFHIDASWGSFGFVNSLYKNVKPDEPVAGTLDDNWFEGAVKPGLSATYTGGSSWQVYGKISGAGERTYAAPPSLVGGAASSFQLEDLFVGWRSGKLFEGLGENALDFTAGRAPYQIGHGFLVFDGAAEGGSRGGYWTNVRRAFAFASVGRFKTGAHTVEAFYLVKDELPEATTNSHLLGFNYELALPLGKSTTLGATYMRASADPAKAPGRDGMNVYNLRAFAAPVTALPGLAFEAEYAREHNGKVLDATAWNVQASYEFSSIAWSPRLSYRYAFFQGDDTATTRSGSFDPLFLGFYQWGTWFQGEIAGEYFVSNSNLISHQVRLDVAPLPSLGTGLIFYKFLFENPASVIPSGGTAATVTSSDIALEVDWYTDWKISDHFSASFIGAFASPGDGVAQAYGRTSDFWYAMIFAAYTY
jgi:hypothetical protein